MNLYSDLIERRSFEDRRQINIDLEASWLSIQRERRQSERRKVYFPSEQETTADSLRQSGMVVR